MRAIGIRSFGGPEVLEAVTIPVPEPPAGSVRVKVAYTGVNPIDVHIRRGAFLGRSRADPSWPMVLGYEGVGTVDALGDGVEGVAMGQSVAWCGVPGAHAEMAVVPAWRIVPVPDRLPLDIACALQLDGMLAHALAVSVFPIRPGDSILVLAAADPAALILIQIAKAQGARVIAAVENGADVGGPTNAGADRVVDMSAEDLSAIVTAETGGEGCHAVFDAFGQPTIASSIACCRRRGMIVLHGGHRGPVDTISTGALAAAGSLYFCRPHLSDFMQDATEVRWRMGGLFEACLEGQLKVGPGRILPLEAAREGHLTLEAGTAAGKILLKA